MFKMQFDVHGEDLDNDNKKIADVLRRMADDVEKYAAGPVRDADGKLIGAWSITKNYPKPQRDNPDDADWFGDDVNGLPTVYDSEGHQAYEEDVYWSNARGDWWPRGTRVREI